MGIGIVSSIFEMVAYIFFNFWLNVPFQAFTGMPILPSQKSKGEQVVTSLCANGLVSCNEKDTFSLNIVYENLLHTD